MSVDISDTLLVRVIKKLQLVLLLSLVLMWFSLYFESVITEILISYLPQYLILFAGALLVLFTLYLRFFIRGGLIKCFSILTRWDKLIFAVVIIGSIGLFGSSLNTYSSVPVTLEPGSGIRVATYNKLYSNNDVDRAIDYFRDEQVSIIGLQEVTEKEIGKIMEGLGFEYSVNTNCNCDAFGTETGIVSQYPIGETKVLDLIKGRVVQAMINTGHDRMLSVNVIHIPTPTSPSNYRDRADAMKAIAKLVAKDEYPKILMGDFNTTVYSPQMREFSDEINKTNGLRNVSQRYWPRCSWFQYTEIFCARIDHIFINRDLGLKQTFIGPNLGADHRPVVAELIIKQP